MNVTEREQSALDEIARRGGGLAGGRQNTQVTNRLVAKGLVVRTNDASGVHVTAAGRAAVSEGVEIA